jgi:hypothetical protein
MHGTYNIRTVVVYTSVLLCLLAILSMILPLKIHEYLYHTHYVREYFALIHLANIYTVCPQSPFGVLKNCGAQTN